jgi:hypothetical protein
MGRKFQVLLVTMAFPVFCLGMRADVSAPPYSAAEWAGAYTYRVQSSTMVYRLVITQDSRFKLVLGGCFGSSEINHGAVAYRDGALILRPGLPADQDSLHEPSRMIPVRSGSRLYLFAEEPFVQFKRDDAW